MLTGPEINRTYSFIQITVFSNSTPFPRSAAPSPSSIQLLRRDFPISLTVLLPSPDRLPSHDRLAAPPDLANRPRLPWRPLLLRAAGRWGGVAMGQRADGTERVPERRPDELRVSKIVGVGKPEGERGRSDGDGGAGGGGAVSEAEEEWWECAWRALI